MLFLSLESLVGCILFDVLAHFGLVLFGFVQVESGSVAVQRVDGVRVGEQLRQERFEHVDQVVHGRPCLVDDVEADGAGCLVDVGMKDAVHEADGGRLERILVGQVHAHLPHAAIIRRRLGPVESDHELIEAAQDGHFVLRLDELDHVRVHTAFTWIWRRHATADLSLSFDSFFSLKTT